MKIGCVKTILGVWVLGTVMIAQQRGTCSHESLVKEASTSEVIAVLEVRKVFSPPGYWSGMIAAMQSVEYMPVESLKGRLEKTPTVVSHYVVSNSPTADPNVPQLSPDLFKPGHKVIAFLDSGPGQFWNEASACRSLENTMCAMVASDDAHKSLVRTSRGERQPTYNVKSETCGVVPANSDLGLRTRQILREAK